VRECNAKKSSMRSLTNPEAPAAMTQWSYHVEAMNISERWWRRKRQAEELTRLNQRLNNLGSAGWELVAYEATPMTRAFTQNIKGYAYLALFKCPRRDLEAREPAP
jgi:hypothetical protein